MDSLIDYIERIYLSHIKADSQLIWLKAFRSRINEMINARRETAMYEWSFQELSGEFDELTIDELRGAVKVYREYRGMVTKS